MAEITGVAGSAPATDTSTGAAQGQGDPSLLSGQGNANLLDWRASLPENLRSAGVITQHPTLEGAAKTLVSQGEMLGRALFLPKEEAGTDAHTAGMQKVYKTLGRPDTADAYELPTPEGHALDAAIATRWKTAFHAAGLSQGQVKEVMDEYWRTVTYADNVHAGAEARSYEEGRRALQAEFGASTDDIIEKAKGFFDHFGAGAFGGTAGQEAWQEIMDARLPDGRRLSNSPHVLAAFAEAFDRIGEGEWHDSTFYTPGQNTMETLAKRQADLTARRHSGTITADESAELTKIFGQLSAHRDRQQARR